MVRIDPGPREGVPGDGVGKRSDGNSSRCAFDPRRMACDTMSSVHL